MSAAAPPLPPERLNRGVVWLWRLQALLGTVAALVAGRLAAGPLDGAFATLATVLPPLVGLVVLVVWPQLRWRRWRIDVRAEEIDLRHGGFTLRRTLVPMRRVQHVDAASGVLERIFGLATVTVHTAGGEVEIPGLSNERAHWLQHRIAELARVDD